MQGRRGCGGRRRTPDPDPQHGRACGNSCAADETCVGGAREPLLGVRPVDAAFCDPGSPVYPCGGTDAICSCFLTADGEVRRGDLTTPGPLCRQCQTSADRVTLGFCADALGAISGGPCCGPVADYICLRPCPAWPPVRQRRVRREA